MNANPSPSPFSFSDLEVEDTYIAGMLFAADMCPDATRDVDFRGLDQENGEVHFFIESVVRQDTVIAQVQMKGDLYISAVVPDGQGGAVVFSKKIQRHHAFAEARMWGKRFANGLDGYVFDYAA